MQALAITIFRRQGNKVKYIHRHFVAPPFTKPTIPLTSQRYLGGLIHKLGYKFNRRSTALGFPQDGFYPGL